MDVKKTQIFKESAKIQKCFPTMLLQLIAKNRDR